MGVGVFSKPFKHSHPGIISSWITSPNSSRYTKVHCALTSMTVFEGDITAAGCRFAVIVGQFNSVVTDRLESGALAALRKAGVVDADIDVVHVPGSFEIPVVAKSMAMSGSYDAVICIGAVVRGSTTHYEEVCSAATSGCGNAAISTGMSTHAGRYLVKSSIDLLELESLPCIP